MQSVSSFPLLASIVVNKNAGVAPSNVMAAAPMSSGGGKKNPWKAVLAGGLSGGIEACVTYPTEFIKTRMQLDASLAKGGPIQAAKDTIKTRGVLGLYRGLSVLLVFSIPKAGVRFSSYEAMRNMLVDEKGKLSAGRTVLCGMGAGTLEAIVAVTPMETIKVKIIHDQLSGTPKYKGLVHGIKSIVGEQGFSGIYKGLLPTILRQGSNQAIRFVVYNNVKDYMLSRHPGKDLNPLETALGGAIAGAASVFGNTPIDVVKTRMQGLESSKYTSTWDCVVKTAKNEGIRGFYKGTTARLGRVTGDVALVFTLYEQINKVLDKMWP